MFYRGHHSSLTPNSLAKWRPEVMDANLENEDLASGQRQIVKDA